MSAKDKIKNPNARLYTKQDYSILTGTSRVTVDAWLKTDLEPGRDFERLSNGSEVIIINEKTKNKRPSK